MRLDYLPKEKVLGFAQVENKNGELKIRCFNDLDEKTYRRWDKENFIKNLGKIKRDENDVIHFYRNLNLNRKIDESLIKKYFENKSYLKYQID